jgi:uncharacterized protein YjbI with pentapeptide repeats
MIPTNAILQAIVDLLAADTATLANAAALHVHLSKSNFTPGPDLTPADFTEADFTGATALDAGTGTQQTFVDPSTNLRTIQLLEPAGGWHWDCAGGTLPQTVYGYYVTDHTDADLYGCVKFTTPIVISAAGQGLDIAQVRFTFLNTSPY